MVERKGDVGAQVAPIGFYAAGLGSPLARRLLRLVFGLYFGIALAVTLVQLGGEYMSEREALAQDITESVRLVRPALARALWNFDAPSTQAIVAALEANSAISAVTLVGVARDPYTVGRIPGESGEGVGRFDRAYRAVFPVFFETEDGTRERVAELRVHYAAATVLARAESVLYSMIASAIIKTIALWLILYYVLRQVVSRPVTRLADGVNRVIVDSRGAGNAPAPGRRRIDTPRDELAFLARSFVVMRRALRRSRRALLNYQDELERTVHERTARLAYLADHDELTGALNRRAFERAITALPRRTGENGHALAFIDLDHFKLVNDTHGHEAGDDILRRTAEVLRESIREGDLIARLGGDELAVAFLDCPLREAHRRMEAARREVRRLVRAGPARRLGVGLSAGLVAFRAPVSAADYTRLMQEADVACYAAKAQGRNRVQHFADGVTGPRRRHDIQWLRQVESALRRDGLELYYQPLIARGAEAGSAARRIELLVRLRTDEGELVAPSAFLPVAERFARVVDIDTHVMSAAVALLAENGEVAARLDQVHLNVSAVSLADPQYYRAFVRECRRAGVRPSRFCFEIAETAALAEVEPAARIMRALRRRGVNFALDDFGRGAASFAHIRRLPFDIVKIDGALVRRVQSDSISRAIVESVTGIARQMGFITVAESVEEASVAALVSEFRVDFMQGYHFGAPMPLSMLSKVGQGASARGNAEVFPHRFA